MSIRSLTSSVRPASGPSAAPSSGSSSQVIAVLKGVGFTAGTSATHSTSIFAPGITRAEISTSVEAGRVSPKTSCRTGLTSGRSFDVGEVDGHLDDVGERAAAGGEHGAHVLEHAARLGDDVVTADELALLVDGDDAGDEEEAARLDGVREVRDRLGLAGDPQLTTGSTHQAKCALSASKPPWNTCVAKKSVQCPCWSRSQSNVVHHSTKLPPPSVSGVTRSVAQ